MPPQPVTRIKPGITYSIHAGNLDARPHVAQAIAECINAWSHVDAAMGWLFLCLLNTNEAQGAELYASLENGKAKLDALRALATASLHVNDGTIVSSLIAHVRSQQKIRDKIAHWCWGVSEQLPDSLILVDPKERTIEMGYVKAFIRGGFQTSFKEMFENLDQEALMAKGKQVYAYSVASLRNDRDSFISLESLVKQVALFCVASSEKHPERDALFQTLSGDVRLAKPEAR